MQQERVEIARECMFRATTGCVRKYWRCVMESRQAQIEALMEPRKSATIS